ncbi:HD domain-containing protein [Actinoplanes sp. RD1]|uniref:HD domain-containing protein n=1 Tax=Actinoplanes sp. RD1 TaxID=3064538 RepID=UPI002740F1FB|nr:HD domain-containing protein [Actinoplanes sp. RD1]
MDLPSDDEIRALHERFAPSPAAFAVVWTHCEIVARIAAQLLADPVLAPAGADPALRPAGADPAVRPAGVDPALVRAGALVHDIGVYRLAGEHYIRHGLLGHELLRSAGLPEELCRFCSCHTGVGITRADIAAQRLPLPPGDYVARTEEERLVMYADKFHSKTTPPVFVSAASYARAVARFGPDKAEAFAAMVRRYGEPDLGPLAAEYGHAVT